MNAGDCRIKFGKIDAGDLRHHEKADEDQRRRRRRSGHYTGERCGENRDQKEKPDEDRMQSGPCAFRHTRGRLDVGGHGTDAKQTANRGSERIDNQDLADVDHAAFSVDKPGLFADRRRGAERVEEIDHKHGKQQGQKF